MVTTYDLEEHGPQQKVVPQTYGTARMWKTPKTSWERLEATRFMLSFHNYKKQNLLRVFKKQWAQYVIQLLIFGLTSIFLHKQSLECTNRLRQSPQNCKSVGWLQTYDYESSPHAYSDNHLPQQSKSAFHLSELAGRTIAWPVSLKMK